MTDTATQDFALVTGRPQASVRGTVLWVFLAYALVALITLVGVDWVRGTTALHELGQSANPYFIPARALLLYVLTPLATLAAAAFFMAPGLMVAAATGHRKNVAYWLITGFAWTLVLILPATTVVQLATGIVLKGAAFWLVCLTMGLFALAILTRHLANGHSLRVRLAADRADVVTGILLFLACLILLSPKFYWENFTGDGHGSLQFARLYIHKLWPFWMTEAGTISKAPGLSMVLFVFPMSWFVRLWGEMEYAVRAPLLLYLFLLYPVVAALIRTGTTRVLGALDHLLIAGAIGVYAFSMIYSGGYHPYFGDSPMPAARETLAVALCLMFVLAYAEDRLRQMILAGVLVGITIPTGGLWLGMASVAGWLVWRPRDVRRTNASIVVILVALSISVFVPRAFEYFGFNYPDEGEFSPKAIIDRLRYVAFLDWNRFLFVIVPCGILPFAALFAYRRQDNVSRLLTLAAAAFFFFFYFQGYRVMLHHFAPVMLVPLVVFWRLRWDQTSSAALVRLALAVFLLLSVWLAWPREMRMHDNERMIGQFSETSGEIYETAERSPGDVYRGFNPRALNMSHILFERLFPIVYTDAEITTQLTGAPLVWWYYSETPKPAGQVINYRIKPVAEAVPADGTLIAEVDGYGLYVADMDLYRQHQAMVPAADTGAAIYVVSRAAIFGRGATTKDRLVIDLVKVAKSLLGKE